MSRKNNFVLYEEYACIIRNHYDAKASRYTIFNLAAGVLFLGLTSHSMLMQEDTPMEVPMAVRIAINSWMPYFKSSLLFFIVVKV